MSKQKNSFTPPDLELKIGENVQIGLDTGSETHPTLLEDITEEGLLVISVPLYRGIPITIKAGQALRLYFCRESARYYLEATVNRTFMHKHLRMASLQVDSEPIKAQRRNSFRLSINMQASLRLYGDGAFPPQLLQREENPQPWETVRTNNFSETGVSVNAPMHYKKGQCVHLKVILEDRDAEIPVELLGVVRQREIIEVLGSPQCRLGVEFLPFEEALRRQIARFILRKQQLSLRIKYDENDEE